MRLYNPKADIFIPDNRPVPEALARTTHLGVGAHQDDLEFMAFHGIAACHGSSELGFTGVVVTDGAGSARAGEFADFSDEEMREVRREEQREAARLGQYAAMVQLDYPSEAVKVVENSRLTEDLLEIFQAARPREVYLHNPADKHDTHIAVLAHALRALRMLPKSMRPEKVYGCEVWRSLDWLVDSDKVIQDVSAREKFGERLAAVFASQIAGGKRYDLAVAGRRFANATFFDAHATDRATALQWAMDLTPLLADETLDPLVYTLCFVERFRADIEKRLRTFFPAEQS